MNKILKIFSAKFLCAMLTFFSFAHIAQAKEIIDMRGKSVVIPDTIEKIATLDDGFVENVLTHIEQIDKVNVIGSWSLKRDYSYTFPKNNGSEYTHAGLNTMRYMHPWLNDLVCVNSPQGNVINYEQLAVSKPDVIVMRVGDCTVRADNMDATQRTIKTIEALNIPLIVTFTPQFDDGFDLSSMQQEAEIIASLFGEEEVNKASALMAYTASIEEMIKSRVKDLTESEKKRVLYFGLNPATREQGGAGTIHGVNTPQSFMIEEVINAQNAFTGVGTNVPISVEQIYALDPDVILLPTMNGYHPAEELYSAPYYSYLKDLRAVKERKAYALPWQPMNCAPRLEYPLELLIMAKAIYPERFQDIIFHEFAIDFYKKVYHVNESEAKNLLETQILTWTIEENW